MIHIRIHFGTCTGSFSFLYRFVSVLVQVYFYPYTSLFLTLQRAILVLMQVHFGTYINTFWCIILLRQCKHYKIKNSAIEIQDLKSIFKLQFLNIVSIEHLLHLQPHPIPSHFTPKSVCNSKIRIPRGQPPPSFSPISCPLMPYKESGSKLGSIFLLEKSALCSIRSYNGFIEFQGVFITLNIIIT